MKSVNCPDGVRLEIESDLGENFLIMEEWAQTNLTQAELDIYMNVELSEAKKALFDRWAIDQQIVSVKMYINDVLQ